MLAERKIIFSGAELLQNESNKENGREIAQYIHRAVIHFLSTAFKRRQQIYLMRILANKTH
jgi:hypothetical protein